MSTHALYLIKLKTESKARPVTRLRYIKHPPGIHLLELLQPSNDILLVAPSNIDYILIRSGTRLPYDDVDTRPKPQPHVTDS